MSDPYSGYVGGQLLQQGLSNFGQGLAEGMQNYQKNKRQDATVTGMLEPYLQNLSAAKDSLSPDAQKSLQKMLDGKASLTDKMMLYGTVSSMQDQKKVQDEAQQRQLQLTQFGQNNQAGAMQLAAQQRIAQAAQNNQMMGQFMQPNGIGGNVGSGVLNPQMQAQAQDPLAQYAAKIQQTTGAPPTSSEMAQLAAQLNQQKIAAQMRTAQQFQPAGWVYTAPSYSADGQPSQNIWTPVQKNGLGEIQMMHDAKATLPAGQLPNGQILDGSSFNPVDRTKYQPPSAPVINTEQRSKDLGQAATDYQGATDTYQKLQALNSQVQAWAQANPKGNFNMLANSPWGLKIKQALGMDPQSQDLQKDFGAAVSPMLSGVKGLRTQREWNSLLDQLPKPTDSAQVAQHAMAAIMGRATPLYQYHQAALQNMQQRGMSLGDAEAAAAQQYLQPAIQQPGQQNAAPAPAAAPGSQGIPNQQVPPALKMGKPYKDRAGNYARWNGTSFVPITAQEAQSGG